jgi:hypothetical protein
MYSITGKSRLYRELVKILAKKAFRPEVLSLATGQTLWQEYHPDG